MNLEFNRVENEDKVWMSDFFSTTNKRNYKDKISQYLYTHQIKATLSTVTTEYEVSIKLKFNSDEDEATFMLYISALDFSE